QSAGWAFAMFVASSTRYAAIYSSFAILVLFLIWLYVSWLILLLGADISFYVQHPEYLYAAPGEPRLSNRMRERLALAVMGDIATNFVQGRPPWTLQQLTERMGIPMHAVTVVADALQDDGLLTKSHDDPPAYLPARDLAEVSAWDIVSAVRRAGEDRFLDPDCLGLPGAAEEIVKRVEAAIHSSLQNISVKALVSDASATPLRSEGSIAAAAEDRVRVVGGTLKS